MEELVRGMRAHGIGMVRRSMGCHGQGRRGGRGEDILQGRRDCKSHSAQRQRCKGEHETSPPPNTFPAHNAHPRGGRGSDSNSGERE